MNLNRNLDEFVVDANILTSENIQIEPKYRNSNSKLIKETNMIIRHDKLVISIQIMSLGGVYVYISDNNQLKKLLFEIKGSLLCQNGCQLFQIQNALILLLIFQDGQVIMRDLKEGTQEILNISENFLIVSRCNFVKDCINFLVMVDVNEMVLFKYENKELKVQNYQMSSWIEYFSEKYIFDYLIEIIEGTHIGIMEDQLVMMQLAGKNIGFSNAKLQITQQKSKIYMVEFFPFSPFKTNKKALFASIVVKTYTQVDLYELKIFTDIKESLQFKEVEGFTFKSFQLELKHSFSLPCTMLYTKEQIFMNSQYLFLTQNSTVKYVDLFGNGQFNQVLSLGANKYLISIIADDVPIILYDQYTSLLCQSPNILQQQYCTYKQQAWYYMQRMQDKFQETNDMSLIVQNLKFNFDNYDLEDFFLLLHIIFRQPLLMYDKIDNYVQPQLIDLLFDIFEETNDDFIYVKHIFKRFDKQLLLDQIYDILGQIDSFIKSQDQDQINQKKLFHIKNENILRLILVTSSHLLQDLHKYHFYCIVGLYFLTLDNEEQIEVIKKYESSYFLLLSSVKLILSKQVKNHLLSKQLSEISEQSETFNQQEIVFGVNSMIRDIFDVKDISRLLAYNAEFNQNIYRIFKIYPLDKQLLLEYQILNLIKKYKTGNQLTHELLNKLTFYRQLYGIKESKRMIRLIIKKFINQNVINYILIKQNEDEDKDLDEDLLVKLIDYPEKFDFDDCLGLIINNIKVEQFKQIIPMFQMQKTLKQLSNTKISKFSLIIDNPLLMYIYKQIIKDLNDCNLSSQESINILLHQANLLSRQGLKKKAMELMMLQYNLLDLQDKDVNLINQQTDILMNMLTVFQGMSPKNRYFLVFKDTNNINFLKTRKESTGQLVQKKILPLRIRLNNIWRRINTEISQLKTLCPIIKREALQNNLTYGEYYQKNLLNRLSDNFRFIKPDQKKLKFIKAAFYQQQILYNLKQRPDEGLKKYNEIISIQNSNKLLKQNSQPNTRSIIAKIEKIGQVYKVYSQREILTIVEFMCIQQFLMLNGYPYTEVTQTMAIQLLDIIDLKSDQNTEESKDDIIIASVYFIELIKHYDSEKIQLRINKILDICMKHNIISVLLDKVLNQKPSKFIVKSIINYLYQEEQDDLILQYFSTSFTEWAIQELIYIENYQMAEILAFKLLSKFVSARLGSKKYCLEPETVEAIFAIQGSDQFTRVLRLLKLLSQKKSEQNFKLKFFQLNGITYQQYLIFTNKQTIQLNKMELPLPDYIKYVYGRLKILKANNSKNQGKLIKNKAVKNISNTRQNLKTTNLKKKKTISVNLIQRPIETISQIYELLQQRMNYDGQMIIKSHQPVLSLEFHDQKRPSVINTQENRKLTFTNYSQNSDPLDQRLNSILPNKEILIIDQINVLEADDRLEVTDTEKKSKKAEKQINVDEGKDQKINQIYLKTQEEKLQVKLWDDQDNRETDFPILIKNQPMKQKDQFESSRSTIAQSRICTSEHSYRDSSISVQQEGLNQINKQFLQYAAQPFRLFIRNNPSQEK